LQTPLKSTDTGQHLASVQALVQKHFLTEAELAKMGKRIADLDSQAPRHIAVGNEEATLLQNSLSRLNDQYKLYVLPARFFPICQWNR
jgi:Spectrin repeat